MAKGDRTQAPQSNQNNGPSLGWGNQSNNNSNSGSQQNNSGQQINNSNSGSSPTNNQGSYGGYNSPSPTPIGFSSHPSWGFNQNMAGIMGNYNNFANRPNYGGNTQGTMGDFTPNPQAIDAMRQAGGDLGRAQMILNSQGYPQSSFDQAGIMGFNPHLPIRNNPGMMNGMQGGNIMMPNRPQLGPSSDIWAPQNIFNQQAINARLSALHNDPNYNPNQVWT